MRQCCEEKLRAVRRCPRSELRSAEEEAMLGTKSDHEIAKVWGRRESAVLQRRVILHIPVFRSQYREWTADEEKLLGTDSDENIGKLIRRSMKSARARRRRNGLLLPLEKGKPWSPPDDALLGKKAANP